MLILGDLPSSWVWNILQIKEHSQKSTPYLFQNDVVLYIEYYWKRETEADINKINDWASHWKKKEILRLTWRKGMASKREREIAADNGMWLTHPSHLTIKKWGEREGGAQY